MAFIWQRQVRIHGCYLASEQWHCSAPSCSATAKLGELRHGDGYVRYGKARQSAVMQWHGFVLPCTVLAKQSVVTQRQGDVKHRHGKVEHR